MATSTNTFTENESSSYKSTWTITTVHSDIETTGSTFRITAPTLKAKYVYSGKKYFEVSIMIDGFINGEYFGQFEYEKISAATSGTTYTIPAIADSYYGIKTYYDLNTADYFDSSVSGNSVNITYRFSFIFLRSKQSDSVKDNCYTYSNGGVIGKGTLLSFSTYPKLIDKVPPTCSVSAITDISGMASWRKLLSCARVTLSNSTAYYGASVVSTKVVIGTNSCSGTGDGTHDVSIKDAGTLTPLISITDSRGNSNSYSLSAITVADYSIPSVNSIELERYGSESTSAKAKINISYSPFSSNYLGIPVVTLEGETVTCSWYTDEECQTAYTGQYSGTSPIVLYGLIGGTYETDETYTFGIQISDTNKTSETKTEVLSTIFITIDFQEGGKEIAFGDMADDDVTDHPDGLFKCSMDIIGRGFLEYCHPVGEVFTTTNADFNPNTIWGGTWEKLTADAYLKIVTSGGGATGGTSSAHKIPLASIPAHSHKIQYRAYAGSGTARRSGPYGASADYTDVTTSTAGSGNAYYPYYYGVYAWHRTA